MSISLNPILTSNALGSFSTETTGYVQGTLLDNPPDLYRIAGGLVAPTETIPMWGGIGISENIPTPNSVTLPNDSLGSSLVRATSISSTVPLTGFTVFNQAHGMITSPQSECPAASAGMSVHFVRLGSGVRLAVACDPGLAVLEAGAINQQVSWDFNDQVLQFYDASTATTSVTSITWAATNGGQGAVVLAAPPPTSYVPAVGDYINISGATNTGTGGNAAVNGTFQITILGVDASHFTIAMPAAAGVIATIAGTIVLNWGTGALPVKVLGFNIGNSLVARYDVINNFVHWNRSGSTAIILV